MSKELTPLKALENIREKVGKQPIAYFWGKNKIDYDRTIIVDDYCDIIETALKRLENYEQNEDFSKDVLNYAFLNKKDIIKQLKALEIIKIKPIDMYVFKYHHSCVDEYNDYHDYVYDDLTQEEYDLLKEVLL